MKKNGTDGVDSRDQGTENGERRTENGQDMGTCSVTRNRKVHSAVTVPGSDAPLYGLKTLCGARGLYWQREIVGVSCLRCAKVLAKRDAKGGVVPCSAEVE